MNEENRCKYLEYLCHDDEGFALIIIIIIIKGWNNGDEKKKKKGCFHPPSKKFRNKLYKGWKNDWGI